MTRETLPNARRRGFIITRDMIPIDAADRDFVNQYLMEETPLYRRPFRPLQLTEPNTEPDHNYLLICDDIDVLQRIPRWRHGDILYKPGIASDLDARLGEFNEDPVSRIFGLKLRREWQSRAPSPAAARERELAMLAVGQQHCRFATLGPSEFFLGPKHVRLKFIAAGVGVTRVA